MSAGGDASRHDGGLDDERDDPEHDDPEYDGPADPERRPTAADGAEGTVWQALAEVEDPELPVDIVDLGLIYRVEVDEGRATVDLTVTYSGCPGRDMIVDDARDAVLAVEGVEEVDIQVVYAPPWTPERITAAGREALAEFGLAVPGAPDRPDPDCHR